MEERKLQKYIFQMGHISSWGKWKSNHYNLKIPHAELVVLLVNEHAKGILKPLHRVKDRQEVAKNLEIAIQLSETKITDFFISIASTEISDRYKDILSKRTTSLFCAIIEAYEPNIVKGIFNEILESELEESEIKKMISWDEYNDKYFDSFFKRIKKLLPEGIHSDFYNKRIKDKLRSQFPTKESQPPITPPRPEAKPSPMMTKRAKEKTSKSPSVGPQKPKDTRLQDATIKSEGGQGEVKPLITTKNGPIVSIESPNTSIDLEVEIVPKPVVLQNSKDTRLQDAAKRTEPQEEQGGQGEVKPLITTKNGPIVSIESPNTSTDLEVEAVLKPVVLQKPKENLLERAARQAQERKENKSDDRSAEIKDNTPIEYPMVWKPKRKWKRFWSNRQKNKHGEIWNAASIGKDYLMNPLERKKLTRQKDINQDLVIVHSQRKNPKDYKVLMFDGVSQSRAPRQWAEYLSEVYIENKMDIEKIKRYENEVQYWHKESVQRWERWVEEKYLPLRSHIPSWRLKNEPKLSHTTFIAIEIDSNKVNIACIGDSAVFCKLKSGEIKHLPESYNHLLRPNNISTKKLYEQEEMEFLSIKLDELDSLLACTDSIADYIFDKDQNILQQKFTEIYGNLSTEGDKFHYMVGMIEKGPSQGGWLEDDVSFFTFNTAQNKVGEE